MGGREQINIKQHRHRFIFVANTNQNISQQPKNCMLEVTFREAQGRLTYTMTGMKMEGRMLLSSTLVSGSKTAYETKKMVSVALYCGTERSSSESSPAILAFPMLVRSRKARR